MTVLSLNSTVTRSGCPPAWMYEVPSSGAISALTLPFFSPNEAEATGAIARSTKLTAINSTAARRLPRSCLATVGPPSSLLRLMLFHALPMPPDPALAAFASCRRNDVSGTHHARGSGRGVVGNDWRRLTGVSLARRRQRRRFRQSAVDPGVVDVVLLVTIPADKLIPGAEEDVVPAGAGVEEVGI